MKKEDDVKGEELVDLNGDGTEKKEEKKEEESKKSNGALKYIMIPLLCLIAIGGILYTVKIYKKINQIELIVCKDYDEMSARAAKIISDLIKENPRCNLGLATGSTPLGLYNILIEQNKRKEISFKDVKTFNLDEYCGIPRNHEQTYFTYMKEHLFKFIDVDLANTNIPKGEGDLESNVRNYEEILKKNKINLQILGIGRNGHIGFNEPGTNFDMGVHIVDLQNKTIHDNARFFDYDINKVPKKAITMGIKNILDADNIILMANGTNKADAIKNVMSGVVDINIPATALNTHKGKVYVIVDKDSASKL